MTTILYPHHEQHWPDQVLPRRLEEYVRDDGSPPTTNRAFAKKVTGQQVLAAITRAQKKLGAENIDPRYHVGTCFHEAGCINEWDTEIGSQRAPLGFVTVGAFQISEEEATRFRFKLEDMLDLDKAATVFVRLSEANREVIRLAAGLPSKAPDPDYTDPEGITWKGGAVRAYLGIAHNKGTGFVRSTIKTYGLDWPAYKKRNSTDNIVSRGYGEHCVTGGPYWPSSVTVAPVGHRTLSLVKPYMTGEDVRELQRHLGIFPDGVFGSKTKTALKEFQDSEGLVGDGICGPNTWDLILKA